jgi:hypothetical protein
MRAREETPATMAEVTEPPDHRWRADDDKGRPIPAGVNPAIPSPARMYDYYLGGCFL